MSSYLIYLFIRRRRWWWFIQWRCVLSERALVTHNCPLPTKPNQTLPNQIKTCWVVLCWPVVTRRVKTSEGRAAPLRFAWLKRESRWQRRVKSGPLYLTYCTRKYKHGLFPFLNPYNKEHDIADIFMAFLNSCTWFYKWLCDTLTWLLCW